MNAARVSRISAVAAVCAATLLMGGCSGDDKSESTSDPSGSASGGDQVPVQAEVGKVEGKLRPAAAQAAVNGITPVVDGWFKAAYLDGDYPRSDFADSFPGFTPGAAQDATKDEALMTNAEVGADIDGVTADLKQLQVDLLAADKEPAGATARFTLKFTTTGTYAKEVNVEGRLFLTKGPEGKWRVFGYDVTRSAA